jgi:hypothetical protein
MSEFQSCVCPFCNSIDTRMGEHGDQHYVWCHACRASGPECDTEAEAIETWDKPRKMMGVSDLHLSIHFDKRYTMERLCLVKDEHGELCYFNDILDYIEEAIK